MEKEKGAEKEKITGKILDTLRELLELRVRTFLPDEQFAKAGRLPPPEQSRAVKQALSGEKTKVLRIVEEERPGEEPKRKIAPVKVIVAAILEKGAVAQNCSFSPLVEGLFASWQEKPFPLRSALSLPSETDLEINLIPLVVSERGVRIGARRKEEIGLISCDLWELTGKLKEEMKDEPERGIITLPIVAAGSSFILNHEEAMESLSPLVLVDLSLGNINLTEKKENQNV